MNKNLTDFLSGQKVIAVKTAEDMQRFVNWLEKYDIYDILVCNQLHKKDYAKISFWKNQAKQIMEHNNEWIHPSLFTIYFHFYGFIGWFYKKQQIKDEFGDTNCIIQASEL